MVDRFARVVAALALVLIGEWAAAQVFGDDLIAPAAKALIIVVAIILAFSVTEIQRLLPASSLERWKRELADEVAARSFGSRDQLLPEGLGLQRQLLVPSAAVDTRDVSMRERNIKGSQPVIDCFEVVDRRMFLHGDAGSGKSMAAYSVAEHLATLGFAPIVVQLRSWDPTGLGETDLFRQFLIRHLTETSGYGLRSLENAREWIATGAYSLVLDGLDEVPTTDERLQLVAALEVLLRQKPDMPVLVTCRTNVATELQSHDAIPPLVEACELRLLSNSQVKAITKAMRKHEPRWQDLERSRSLREAMKLPLVASLSIDEAQDLDKLADLLDQLPHGQDATAVVVANYVDSITSSHPLHSSEVVTGAVRRLFAGREDVQLADFARWPTFYFERLVGAAITAIAVVLAWIAQPPAQWLGKPSLICAVLIVMIARPPHDRPVGWLSEHTSDFVHDNPGKPFYRTLNWVFTYWVLINIFLLGRNDQWEAVPWVLVGSATAMLATFAIRSMRRRRRPLARRITEKTIVGYAGLTALASLLAALSPGTTLWALPIVTVLVALMLDELASSDTGTRRMGPSSGYLLTPLAASRRIADAYRPRVLATAAASLIVTTAASELSWRTVGLIAIAAAVLNWHILCISQRRRSDPTNRSPLTAALITATTTGLTSGVLTYSLFGSKGIYLAIPIALAAGLDNGGMFILLAAWRLRTLEPGLSARQVLRLVDWCKDTGLLRPIGTGLGVQHRHNLVHAALLGEDLTTRIRQKAAQELVHVIGGGDSDDQRRAAVALLNAGVETQRATDTLLEHLEGDDKRLQGAAAVALLNAGAETQRATDTLLEHLEADQAWIRSSAAACCLTLGIENQRASDVLLNRLDEDHRSTGIEAAAALLAANSETRRATTFLINDLKARPTRFNGLAARRLVGSGNPQAMDDAASDLLAIDDVWLRHNCAVGLLTAGVEVDAAIEVLNSHLDRNDPDVQREAADALLTAGVEVDAAIEVLNSHLDRNDDWIQLGAAMVLSSLASLSERAIDILETQLNHTDDWIQVGAAQALLTAGAHTSRATAVLTDQLTHARKEIQKEAALALISADEESAVLNSSDEHVRTVLLRRRPKVEHLELLLEDPSPHIRRRAAHHAIHVQ